MTGFLIMTGAMIALGLAFILVPLTGRRSNAEGLPQLQSNMLIHRDQLKQLQAERNSGTISADEYESEQRELGKRVIEDALAALKETVPLRTGPSGRLTAVAMAILFPAAAVGVYLSLGSPSLLAVAEPRPVAAAAQEQASPHGMSFEQIGASADKLAAHMAANPDDGEGWAMLARSHNVLGRYEQAAAAYKEAVSRLPPDAQLMADYADALAMSRGGRLAGKPLEIIRLALKTDPSNLKALALAGTEAYERKSFAEAVKYWEKVVQLAPADSEFARSIGTSLEEARALAAGRPPVTALPQIMPARSESPLPPASGTISGSVSLRPELAARVKADDTVFIFARAENGSRMPLAILSRKAGELPLRFVLDDTNGMSPDMRLSRAAAVKVFARISRSGNASAQSGDLEGASGPVKPGSQGLQIDIDKVLP